MNPTQDPKKQTYFGFEIEDIAKSILELEELQEQFGQGLFEKIIPLPEGAHERLKDALGDKYDAQGAEQRVRNIIKRSVVDGVMLKDAIGLSAPSMEAFYYLAYCFYQNDRLAESFSLFKVLCALDPLQWKYFYALGSVLHKQKNYKTAALQYILATSLHPQEKFPLGHYHCATCYAELGDLTSALVALGMAMDACDEGIEEHRVLRQRARDLESVYKQQLINQVTAPSPAASAEVP